MYSDKHYHSQKVGYAPAGKSSTLQSSSEEVASPSMMLISQGTIVAAWPTSSGISDNVSTGKALSYWQWLKVARA